MVDAAQAKMIAECAKQISIFEVKDPNRLYKGKPHWHLNIELATHIVMSLPRPKLIINDERLKIALVRYIEIFNKGSPNYLEEYILVDRMPPRVLSLHCDALKAAFESLIK